jgi:hypothetical protein
MYEINVVQFSIVCGGRVACKAWRNVNGFTLPITDFALNICACYLYKKLDLDLLLHNSIPSLLLHYPD